MKNILLILLIALICIAGLEYTDYLLDQRDKQQQMTVHDILEQHRQSHVLTPNRDAVEQQIEYLTRSK